MPTSITLHAGPEGLELRRDDGVRGAGLRLADVERRVAEGRRSALARACGAAPGVSVLDAMAGVGLDGLVLACLGCDVTLVESSDLVFAVLSDGADRVRTAFEPSGSVSCVHGDALAWLDGARQWDVVYLDPMFPERNKRALPRLRMQLLAEAADHRSVPLAALVERARRVARDRVVLKRRATDPAAVAPDWQIRAHRVRFDVFRGTPIPLR